MSSRVWRWVLAVGIAVGAAGMAPAAETNGGERLVRTLRGADVRLWGQINRAALFADNGTDSEWFHVDNDSSPSRLGVAGDYRQEGWGEVTVGGQIELGFKSDNSAEVVFGGPDPEFKVDGRKIEAYVKSPRFGTLSAGQGDMASNGTAEEDLSGTYVTGYSQVRFAAGSLVFGPGTNGPAVKQVFNNFDGLHRDDRIRYDSPGWRGLSAAISFAGGDAWDAALRHQAVLGAHQIASAVAYARKAPGVDQVSGSCSLRLGCGLNLTAAAGGQDTDGDASPLSFYVKAGWRMEWFPCGETMLAADYSRNEEIGRPGDLAESHGLMLNQRVEAVSSELYATVRRYDLDRPGEEYDDLVIFMSGIRLAF